MAKRNKVEPAVHPAKDSGADPKKRNLRYVVTHGHSGARDPLVRGVLNPRTGVALHRRGRAARATLRTLLGT